uniref:Uncharacterized protein n=1 Tax=Plectus sambesii TaxID=2011161 RepID=A0A914WBU6_9BILA
MTAQISKPLEYTTMVFRRVIVIKSLRVIADAALGDVVSTYAYGSQVLNRTDRPELVLGGAPGVYIAWWSARQNSNKTGEMMKQLNSSVAVAVEIVAVA